MPHTLSDTVLLEVQSGTAILWCDNPPVNAISQSVRSGLSKGIQFLNQHDDCKLGIIICKGRSFFVGADITEFGKKLPGPSWSQTDRDIDLSPKPIIAAIHGTCYGGGLEYALACHYRIADSRAVFGFPEIKLGLIPGGGGTQRFPRVAGFGAALRLIPTGETFNAEEALKIGLVDTLTTDDLLQSALMRAEEVIRRGALAIPPARMREEKIQEAKSAPQIFEDARRVARKRYRGRTAPLRAIDAIENALAMSFEAAMEAEAKIFTECQRSAEHRALSHLFFAEREARHVPGVSSSTPARKITNISIIGGGTMGRGIALAFAQNNVPCRIIEVSETAAQEALRAIFANLDEAVAKGKLSSSELDRYRRGIQVSADWDQISDSDLVIEAVFENLDLKQSIFKKLAHTARPNTILATNTSNLDVNEIALASGRPEDVIGLHFFNPAHVMKLLEIVRGDRTSPDVLASCLALSKTLNKQPVVARVCDGFIVNRVFAEYWKQSRYLVEEGASPYDVDKALWDFGMPLGPFAVSDLVGLDVSKAIRKNRRSTHSDHRPDTLEDELADFGRHGRKSGLGWYSYDEDARAGSPDPFVLDFVDEYRRRRRITPRTISSEEIIERCIFGVINEGAKLVEEGIALRASDVDVAAVLGYGFPAYRGGPMHYAEEIGIDRVTTTVKRLHQTQGAAWRPSRILMELAASGRGFSELKAS